MTKETMTIHKALSELKTIDNRIGAAIVGGTYCIANKHCNEKIRGVAVGDFTKVIQGHYDRATTLIDRRNAIKRAVVLSNAVTTVEINGAKYTVAEAIEMKNHGMDHYKTLLAMLKSQYNSAQSEILKNNGAELEKRAEQYVIGLYGQKEGKTNAADIDKTKHDFVVSQTYELIDPIKILEKIDELDDYISNFTSEIDAILSVSNAVTTIDVEY